MLAIMGGLVVLQLLMQTGAAQRMKGQGRAVLTGRALNVIAGSDSVALGNVADQLYDLVLPLLMLGAAQGAPRDPRRDSRGERSPWLPLETRPDSPGEPGMQP